MYYPQIKETAKRMRQNGASFGDISKKLNVAKSTLSFWFKDIVLTENTIIKIKKSGNNLRGKIAGAVGSYNASSLFFNNPEKFEEEVRIYKPDLVGVSLLSSEYAEIGNIAIEIIKKANKEIIKQ